MIGTAEPVDVWVLLEYKPAWKARAVEESGLDAATRRWLDDNLAALHQMGLKARPQLIRQPEIDSAAVRLLVGTPGALFQFSGSGYGFLQDISLSDVVAHPDRHEPLRGAHYFVCTNGQRDLCCARFGLPVYAGLRERVGERVWQVTHLGGHRFAPNVLVLPQGAVYGRVQEAGLDDFVADLESGTLAFRYLRGRSWYAGVVQAAEALSGRSDLTLTAVDEQGLRATVTFDSPQGAVSVRVRQADEALAVLKSCADDQAKPVAPYLAD